jgi:hypothetical protein
MPDYCSNLFFAPATNAAVLHLMLTHNNAVDMFIDLMTNSAPPIIHRQ